MLSFLVITCCALGQGGLITLDNGSIRVEVDPQTFSVCFVGVPGGQNFLEPLPLTDAQRDGDEWVDAGGLQTDLLPYTARDAAIRRGPAQVIESREDYVALLGPPSAESGMRLKKEVQLTGREPMARFRVTAMRVSGGPVSAALRNTVRVPAHTQVRVERGSGDIIPLAGTESLAPAAVKSRKFWIIPVPPTAPTNGVILGCTSDGVTLTNKSGSWTRRLAGPRVAPEQTPGGHTLLCLLDDKTSSYGVSLQGALTKVAAGEIVSQEEEWTIDARGK